MVKVWVCAGFTILAFVGGIITIPEAWADQSGGGRVIVIVFLISVPIAMGGVYFLWETNSPGGRFNMGDQGSSPVACLGILLILAFLPAALAALYSTYALFLYDPQM